MTTIKRQDFKKVHDTTLLDGELYLARYDGCAKPYGILRYIEVEDGYSTWIDVADGMQINAPDAILEIEQ